jgi:hypothetical protein
MFSSLERSRTLKNPERLRQIIPLWLKRPQNKRTEDDVVIFYGWLEENRPEFLKRSGGDPYRWLHAGLRNHIMRLAPRQPFSIG